MAGVPKWLVAFRSLLLALALATSFIAPSRAGPSDKVLLVEISGAISIAAQRQISRAVDQARKDSAAAIVIRLDTPGGLVSATRDVIRDIVAAPVPVIIYVAPGGARAASAGTFVVYASHLAAMAPGTNIGAATPVSLGGVPGVPQPKDEKKNEPSAAEKKSINDVVALLRSLGQMRGRNLEFAEKAVRDAATMTAEEAHKQGVVEIIAGNVADLLAQADGRKIKVGAGERTLSTRDAEVVMVVPDWRTRLLGVIADPNIAFILLLIGIYGLLFEFWSGPGVVVPGVIGGICLLLAMIALSLLPVQYGALALLLLGIALMAGEAFTPGVGALGIGGLIAFVVGAFFLFEPEGADFSLRVSLPVIIGAAIATAGLSFLVLGAAVKARRRPPATGAEEMLGAPGTIIDWQSDQGHVRVHGEIWSARADKAFMPGDAVRVRRRDGLVLLVDSE